MNGRAKRGFSLRRGRRSGFILITALVIILLGAALSVGVFALANSMLTTDVVNRKGYEEQTEVVRYIELAKGFIVTRNIELASRDEPVLHGQGGASNDYFVVRRLDDLQVCKPQAVGDVLSQDVLLSARGGERRLRLQVFDANYRVSDIRFATTPEMPPSLSPLSRSSGGGGDGDSYEDEGEGTDSSTGAPPFGDVVPMDYYKNYGAYMIRVEVYREGQSTPLRRTEEAFFQYVKKGT